MMTLESVVMASINVVMEKEAEAGKLKGRKKKFK